MKETSSFEPHLVIKEVSLLPGGEWSPPGPGWSILRVTTGIGYWLHPRMSQELATGAVLVCSDRAPGIIRASQLATALLHAFRLDPDRLSGVVTLGEQQYLRNSAAHDKLSARFFPPTHPISENFRKVCESRNGNSFSHRVQLLDLFTQAFGTELASRSVEPPQTPDAKMRLREMLEKMPASDLLNLSFAQLVQEMRCTPRHLSRIFHQAVGMSFRQKQAEVRLIRAQELLASSETKVLEVALESGYQSLSLFNLMFKKRFGMSPGKWRDQVKTCKSPRRAATRLQLVRM